MKAAVISFFILFMVMGLMIFAPRADPRVVELLEQRVEYLESQTLPPPGYHTEIVSIWTTCDPEVTGGKEVSEAECERIIRAGLQTHFVVDGLSMGGEQR